MKNFGGHMVFGGGSEGGGEGAHRVIQSLMSGSGELFISGMTSRAIGNS